MQDQTDEFTFGVPVRNTRTVPGSTAIPGSGNNSGLIPLDVRLDEYNNLYGTFGNSSILAESFYRDSRTRFKYGIVRANYELTDTLTLSAQGNLSESVAVYSENRVISNIYGITTTFDPTGNINYPTISSPTDFTNPANFRAPSLGFAINDEVDKQKTPRGVVDWAPVDTGDRTLSFKAGASYVSTTKRIQRQDGTSIGLTRAIPQGGTFATNSTGVFQNMDPFVQFGELWNGGNDGYPSNFATFSRDFVLNVLDANGANRAAPVALNQAFSAEEIVKSAFVETSFELPIAGHALRGNLGLRYSDTKTVINNYQSAGAGVFKKDIVDRLFSQIDFIPFSQTGLPSSAFSCASLGSPACVDGIIDANYLFRRTITVNQNELKLRGLELAYQHNFTFLPQPFDGLGITSSFTLIDQDGDDFVLTTGERIALQGVPDYSYSVTMFYEKGPFSIRGSYNYRAKTGQNSINTGNDQVPYLAPQAFLDGTVSYRTTDAIELRVDALNISNENVYQYYVDPRQPDGNGQSRRDNSFFNGTTIAFGVRGSF